MTYTVIESLSVMVVMYVSSADPLCLCSSTAHLTGQVIVPNPDINSFSASD